MRNRTFTVIYFVLTFLAGVGVGGWSLWLYIMGAPGEEPAQSESVSLPVEHLAPETPVQPEAGRPPSAGTASAPALTVPETPPAADAPKPTPTPKGHWETVDSPGHAHEECLAKTKGELNDAYKDCRFGTHQQVWVAE